MKTLSLVAALALVSISGFASAADTQTVAVTASIQSICKFSGAAAAVAFGTINPSDAAAVKSMPLTIPYKCTNGFTPTITTGAITPLTNAASSTMAFTVDTFVTPVATGFTTAVNGTASVNIAAAVWQNAPAGAYTGSVVLNINN
ncbi:MAG: hypothetical protein H7224_02980 [Polaromonas sp.]|nr:hypothetical protein [Polaromonas sp.]